MTRNFGYTLIEMLVVITILGLLLGGGIASLVTFRDKQHLKRAGTQIYSDLRLAQAKAQAGQRPAACAVGKLEAYGVRMANGSNGYQVVAICDQVVSVDVERELPNKVTSVTSVNCGTLVSFGILAKAATPGKLCLTFGGRFYQVEVTKGGQVIDNGFVGQP